MPPITLCANANRATHVQARPAKSVDRCRPPPDPRPRHSGQVGTPGLVPGLGSFLPRPSMSIVPPWPFHNSTRSSLLQHEEFQCIEQKCVCFLPALTSDPLITVETTKGKVCRASCAAINKEVIAQVLLNCFVHASTDTLWLMAIVACLAIATAACVVIKKKPLLWITSKCG